MQVSLHIHLCAYKGLDFPVLLFASHTFLGLLFFLAKPTRAPYTENYINVSASPSNKIVLCARLDSRLPFMVHAQRAESVLLARLIFSPAIIIFLLLYGVTQ